MKLIILGCMAYMLPIASAFGMIIPAEKTIAYSVGSASIRGQRTTMEDAIVVAPDLRHFGDRVMPGDAFFAVFDGHGGTNVVNFLVQTYFCHFLSGLLLFPNYPLLAFGESCATADEAIFDIITDPSNTRSNIWANAGSTAAMLFVRNQTLYIANIGDSRVMVFDNRDQLLCMTIDHTATTEADHVYRAGGYVVNNRINGALGMGRAFGDFALISYKTPPFKIDTADERRAMAQLKAKFVGDAKLARALPTTNSIKIPSDGCFVILASDGLWEGLTKNDAFECASMIYMKVSAWHKKGMSLNDIAQALVKQAILWGSTDNISVILIHYYPEERTPYARQTLRGLGSSKWKEETYYAHTASMHHNFRQHRDIAHAATKKSPCIPPWNSPWSKCMRGGNGPRMDTPSTRDQGKFGHHNPLGIHLAPCNTSSQR